MPQHGGSDEEGYNIITYAFMEKLVLCLVPVSLNILSLRFPKLPYSLYVTYENLRLKIFSETGTRIILPVSTVFTEYSHNETVLQIRRGKRGDLGIIFHITPLKRMLRPIIRTVLSRGF